VKESTQELIAATALDAATRWPRRERMKRVRAAGSCAAVLRQIPRRDELLAQARARIAAFHDAGFELVSWSERGYPRLLRSIPDPPFVLAVWGALEPADALAIAVVGSRRATRYGRQMSRDIASELSRQGLCIVSGLARGIDRAAHEGALAAGGRTVAVLGSGLANIYPREHRALAEAVAARGAVISELSLHEAPAGANFPRRNRIITGMTLGTLVVEATSKSGSLVSARLAMEQDREVFAVPGLARATNSEGVHALLKDGAKLTACAQDVIEELRPEVQELLATPRGLPDRTPEASSDPCEAQLIRALADAGDGLGLDALLARAPGGTPAALAALSRLEVRGRVWSLPGGLYQLKP